MKILNANDESECADVAIEDLKRTGFPAKTKLVGSAVFLRQLSVRSK